VIGGGFLGSEIALALARRGHEKGMKVSQVLSLRYYYHILISSSHKITLKCSSTS
jgi:hypothetical protein